ncbi:hypothetical protein BC830DRAFT_1123169 [Chytriomyces sp. MP71]|nr:hypothetical protein BC830DRAFT_1123169 [Chytriomyces sp. MP71]
MIDADHRHNSVQARYEAAALNALQLLDMLVKNCGYPFQLTISTKEFLNELVKRFPEKPNAGNVVQFRILELIQQWNSTLCVSSRYKEDFRHITDMYRLLSYKGYRFPGVSTDSAAVLTVSSSLKSENELEEEDRIAQGAKLQELLRLGTPAALEQANELMKVLSGYETERKPDYSKQVSDELERIEAKASALNLLFEQSNPSTREIDELLGSTKSAQTRIQNLISNGEQEDKMDRLLQLNDYINTSLANYQKFRAGQAITKASLPTPSTLGNAKATSPAGPISLIDFDEATIPSSSPFALENFQMPGVVAGAGSASAGSSTATTLNDLSGLDFFGSVSAQPVTVGMKVQPAMAFPVMGSGQPMYGMGLGGGGGLSTMTPSVTTPVMQAAIVGPNTGSGGGVSLLDTSVNLLNHSLTVGASKPVSPVLANISAPMQSLSIAHETKEARIFNKNGLQIKVKYSMDAQRGWHAQAVFMNTTPVPFEQLTFLVAVPKVMQLTMQPLSGTTVPALNTAQVTQAMSIVNASNEPIKLRFKICYDLNGALVEESGEHVF